MLLSIIVRAIGFLAAVTILIGSIVIMIKDRKDRKTVIASFLAIAFALFLPYLMLFYGQYRKNNLNLKNNVAEVVAAIENLDLEEYVEDDRYSDGTPIFQGYDCIKTYRAEIDYYYINVTVLKGTKEIDNEEFVSRCYREGAIQGYDEKKFFSKVDYGEVNGYSWASYPLIEYDEPYLKAHTGVYNSEFYIKNGNYIYICDYSMSRKLPISLISFMNVKPKKVSAEKLINMFNGVENMHNISEEEFDA